MAQEVAEQLGLAQPAIELLVLCPASLVTSLPFQTNRILLSIDAHVHVLQW